MKKVYQITFRYPNSIDIHTYTVETFPHYEVNQLLEMNYQEASNEEDDSINIFKISEVTHIIKHVVDKGKIITIFYEMFVTLESA